MALAEKYRDMDTLTEIVVAESQYFLEQQITAAADEKTIIETELQDVNARVGRYFNRFKDDWANAFFNQGFSGNQAGRVLSRAQEYWEKYLDNYLRADPSRAKICWINDITSNSDYKHASQVLAEDATQREEQLWSKKVELSLAKLSMLAADEASNTPAPQEPSHAKKVIESELEVIDVQEKLYRHVLPEVLHALDEHAEIEIAMDRFGQGVKGYTMLTQLLESSFSKLLPHQTLDLEELIDVLTLIDSVRTSNPDADIRGQEFYLALVALNAAAPEIPPARFEMLLQLIWKRAFLDSNWASINKSSTSKRGGADVEDLLENTATFRTLYLGAQSGLFDTSIDKNYVRALSPSECLGAACNASEVAHRFGADLAEPIAHDNRVQDEKLDQAVSRYRINAWFDDCQNLVKKTLEAEAAEKARLEAQGQETESEEASVIILENGNGVNGLTNGHSHAHVNGIKIEDDSGEGETFDGLDGEGDVAME
jgi:nuclear pore complex protein Nup133